MKDHSTPYALRKAIFDGQYTEMGCAGDPCIYCGLPSDALDHVPPLTIVYSLSSAGVTLPQLRKYPACNECNSTLGGRNFTTLKERRRYLLDQYTNKYAKYLRMPTWDNEELAQVGHTLATNIISMGNVTARAKARISRLRGYGPEIRISFDGDEQTSAEIIHLRTIADRKAASRAAWLAKRAEHKAVAERAAARKAASEARKAART
jgi:hypothetical protein